MLNTFLLLIVRYRDSNNNYLSGIIETILQEWKGKKKAEFYSYGVLYLPIRGETFFLLYGEGRGMLLRCFILQQRGLWEILVKTRMLKCKMMVYFATVESMFRKLSTVYVVLYTHVIFTYCTKQWFVNVNLASPQRKWR